MKLPRLLSLLAITALTSSTHAAFQSFEGDGFGDWKTIGSAFGLSPVHGKLDEMKNPFTAYSNNAFATSAHGGDEATGALVSQEFTIKTNFISFLIAGGNHPGKTAVQLLLDGKVEFESTGDNSLRFSPSQWDVTKLKGSRAVIRVIDEEKGRWGIIAVDEILFGNYANPKFPATTKGGKLFAEKLVTTDALAGATIPDGSILKIEADYENQKIKSPTALTFDDQGNVFVAETHRFRHGVEDNRNHLYWYLDDLQSQTTDDRRALHKKWKGKVSEKYMTEVSEVIRRLSDTDGDGTFDESKVFADGFNNLLDGTAAGIFYYDEALYFACIPKIYKLRDTNDDGVSDERKVVEEGFGVRISLSGHDMNGFTLGPDGRIYGTIGDRGFSMVTKAGKELHYPNEGAVFRFEPDGSGFELMHTGLRNPKEIAFDEFGNAFSVDNNSDQGDASRIVYLVEGGESGWQMEHQAMHTFHRQIGLEERPSSRWMNEKMWELENDSQPAYILPPSAHLSAGPSGLTYHPGTGFLESEKGRFLICDYKGGASRSGIWSFAMESKGAGMKMTDARKLTWGIAATDVEYSFDGRVFITDFVTGWKSHDAGRLVSLDAGKNTYLAAEAKHAAELISEGFDQRDSKELGKLLGHSDSRVRLRAQMALTRKIDALPTFVEATKSEDQLKRIHAIWGLGIITRRGSVPRPTDEFVDVPINDLRKNAAKALIEILNDPDPEIRVQALRAIGDAPVDGNSLPLAALLIDKNPRVAFAAGIAIGKMKAIGHSSAILDFIRRNNNQDVYLRHAGIYALEHITTKPAQISALHDHPSAALRLAAVVALRRLNSPEVAYFVRDADPKVQDEAIRAIYDKDMSDVRPAVAALLDELDGRKWTAFMLRRLIHIAYRVGTEENATRLLKVIANASLPQEVREEALRLVMEWEKPFPVDQLNGHWRPLDPRPLETIKPALTAALPDLLKLDGFVLTSALNLVKKFKLSLASLDDETLSKLINNSKLPDDARAKALTLFIERDGRSLNEYLAKLVSDKTDALALTALKSLSERDPESAIAILEKTIDSDNTSRAQKSWSILASIPSDKAAKFIASHLVKLKQANGISACAIELIAAAKTRKEPLVASALTAFEKAMKASDDPLARFNISLEGGNAKNGFSLFTSHPVGQCMRCHKASADAHSAGGDAGPNLAGIAKHHERRYLLESVVNPTAVVAPGFGITSLTFKNGGTLAGNLVEVTPDHIDVATPGKLLRAKRSDVESFTPPISAMPPIEHLLKPEETRDLVAWLASLTKEAKATKAAEPELVDPAKLPGAK